ncbi:MAG TPA: 50S ribosomal protein L32 [Firmicutes bacterium]|nr:50S ribosomal protein L32 [Bacillota bacterium]HBT16485.1 50S ribosomal protein L32 [Bacillota bacterium]
MANPKGRHSQTRGKMRRTHWKLKLTTLSRCEQCQAPRLSHRVCPSCGYYRGRQVINTKS